MNRRWVVPATLFVVALAAVLWAAGLFTSGNYSADPQIAELQRLRDANMREGGDVSDTARDEFRQRMRGLNDEQRREFFISGMASFAPIIERRLDEFFALPRAKQIEKMDQEIDRMEAYRQRSESGGGGMFGGRSTPAQFNEMRKRLLDYTTPELRSKFEKRITMMNDRRAERGLEPLRF